MTTVPSALRLLPRDPHTANLPCLRESLCHVRCGIAILAFSNRTLHLSRKIEVRRFTVEIICSWGLRASEEGGKEWAKGWEGCCQNSEVKFNARRVSENIQAEESELFILSPYYICVVAKIEKSSSQLMLYLKAFLSGIICRILRTK